MTENQIIEEIQKIEVSELHLGPNDALVIRGDFRKPEDAKMFREHLESSWVGAPKGRIIVIPKSIELTAIRQIEG